MENHGEPGKHGKHQIVDLIHSIYDFKNYICDSNQSFCQTDDSKHCLLAFMATVQKLQPTGIALAGCCMYTKSNSFIHFAKRFNVSSCIVSISNPQCASSQFLRWILQPCFVLKSRPEKKQKNFPSFPLSSKPSSIIVSRFCALLMANSNNCMFTVLSKVRYQMSSQMHCFEQFKAKVVSIMQIFYRLCLQM